MTRRGKKKGPSMFYFIILAVVVAIAGFYLSSVWGGSDTAETTPTTQPVNSQNSNTSTATGITNTNTNISTSREKVISSELDSEILTEPAIQQLQQFGEYPVRVTPGEIGRSNPFAGI
jgi:flagellar basal body-associated protein FliL